MPNETGSPVGIHVPEVMLNRKARARVTQSSAEWAVPLGKLKGWEQALGLLPWVGTFKGVL